MAVHATNLTVLPAGVESERSTHHHRVTSPDLRSVMERAHGVGSPEDSGSSGEEAPTSKPLGESLKFHFKTKKTSDSQESLPVRRISLVGPSQGRGAVKPLKEGFVLHQTGGLSRWSKRYCSIEGHHLFIAKNPKEKLREEILLKDATVVEKSTKNINHVFTVMTPHQQIVLAGNSRREMDEWMGSVRVAAASARNKGVIENSQHLDGQHSWFSCSHSRFTYCNVCGEALHGVAWHGLSCEVCRFKSHRRCVFNVKQSCKWATVTSLEKDGADVLPDFSFPHQWLEGNLLPGSKCVICKKACGSTKRLQDFRCIWCKWTVHTDCQDAVQPLCTLGAHRISILPPSLVRRSNAIMEGMWEPYKVSGHSPVLAFVNSKSGDNKGVRFLRKLKTWLNPLQVFDLAISGPEPGLMLFQRMEKFRVLVFGGDGSVGWTLSAIDKFQLHHKCMLGVVPLGTGNDLARVLGWGAQCSDEEKIPQLLTEMEQSTFKYLDRWSVLLTTDPNVDASLFARGTSIESKRGHHRSHSSASSHSSGSKSSQLVEEDGEVGSRVTSPRPRLQTNESTSSVLQHSRSASSGSRNEIEVRNIEMSRQSSESSKEETIQKELQIISGSEDHPVQTIQSFQSSVKDHLSRILVTEEEGAVIGAAQVMFKVVQQFINSIAEQEMASLTSETVQSSNNNSLIQKCNVLSEKLKSILATLSEEAMATTDPQQMSERPKRVFRPREALMTRADSLKKAVEGVIDLTEKTVDAQEQTTAEVKAMTQTA